MQEFDFFNSALLKLNGHTVLGSVVWLLLLLCHSFFYLLPISHKHVGLKSLLNQRESQDGA